MQRQALAGLRVIECGHMVGAAYAAKLLADLGAEVVKIEPPGGDRARQRGPFPRAVPDADRSGLFLYLNTNKRGVTLDLQGGARGRAVLERLVGGADVLVHNLPPADMAASGLDYDALAALNPRLVMASITAYGLSGPRRDWEATNLTLWNAGGIAYLNGSPDAEDLPPLAAYGQQAEYQGGLSGAIAVLGALMARLRSGRGQHVVVSIQESLAAMLELTFEYWPYMGLVASRLGRKPIQPLDFLECADGWIFVCCVEEHQWQEFIRMIGSPEWASIDLFADRLSRGANWDALKLFLQEWASTQRVMEVYHAAQQRRIPFAPVSTMGDLLASDHLKARGFFAVLQPPGMQPVAVPGAPYRLSATPWAIRRPAPRLGEHTAEVLAEIGMPAEMDESRTDDSRREA